MSDIVSALLQGIDHQRRGETDCAEAIYADVLEREPEHSSALYLYGLLQLKDGRAAGAVQLLQRAAHQRPDAEIRLNLARANLANGDHGAALVTIDEVLASQPPCAETLYLRGTALNGLNQPEAAIDALTEATGLSPTHAPSWLNLGNAHADLDQWDVAEAHIRHAISLDPTLVEAHASLGFVLCSAGRHRCAIQACQNALALDPRSPEAHWNLATALLLTGDYVRGFQEYEWHKRHRDFRGYYRDLPGTLWTHSPLDGQTLLVDADQGLGDTIQLARYLPRLAARGARVLLACSTHLIPLLSEQPGIAGVFSRTGTLPEYDCWVDQMSLPRLFGTRPDTIPTPLGYLAADPARQRVWAERLPAARIGLCWAGNPLHSNDRRRSMPLHAVRDLIRPDTISLQTGPRASEAPTLGLHDLSGQLTDFAETAALIANLDLVITVDTAVAHLAGALGVPVWVMLPFAPDWRWMAGRDDTPWYASMRLFRQPAQGDWAAVVQAICSELDVGAELA